MFFFFLLCLLCKINNDPKNTAPKWPFLNEKIWYSETKLWLQVNFSQHDHGYSETSVWFVHVTDIYCSGWTQLGKFQAGFSSHRISFCLKSPHFDGATLNNFGCVYLTEAHVQWSSCHSSYGWKWYFLSKKASHEIEKHS